MKTLIQSLLATLARGILKKYKPDVIGVTGSVGKSSTKEAIYTALYRHYNVWRGQKSYNNELGVPLTIIGADTQGRSVFGWLGVILKALRLLVIRDNNYPQVLILELGADRPGNIASLLQIASCRIGILTAVGPTHLEQLGTVENVLKEKMTLLRSLRGDDALAIINADDELIKGAVHDLSVRVLSFGINTHADLRLENVRQLTRFIPANNDVNMGIEGEIVFGDNREKLFLSHIVGVHQLYSVLAGCAVGLAKGLTLGQIVASLEEYAAPNGRMKLLGGVKNTLIIDDTYNASPKAVRAALDTLVGFEVDSDSRRIAVLGAMAELGEQSDDLHSEIGAYVAGRADILIVVGEKALGIARGAESAGMDKSQIMCFTTAQEAGIKLQELMNMGDVVLVKGSQSARMERITREVMAEPERAKSLLVRQSREWEGR